MAIPPELHQYFADAGEMPGVAQFSPGANEGEVKMYVVLRQHPRRVLYVTIAADVMPDDMPERVEELARGIVNEQGLPWGPRLVG